MYRIVLAFALAAGVSMVARTATAQERTPPPPGISNPAPRPEANPAPMTREARPEPNPGPFTGPVPPASNATKAAKQAQWPEDNTALQSDRRPDYRQNPYWQPKDWTYIENQAP